MTDLTKSLPFDAWPDLDRHLWNQVTDRSDFFSETVGLPAYWRDPTKGKNIQQYGMWLTYLLITGELDQEEHPCDRVTRARAQGYVSSMLDRVSSWTCWSYTVGLHQIMRAFEPDRDWVWLYNITARLQARRRPSKNKHGRMQPADVIACWAAKELDAINQYQNASIQSALAYRNHLLILFLIHCPVRMRNLVCIRLDQHLREGSDGYRLLYKPEEVKNNRFLQMDLSGDLSFYLEHWLQRWRSVLAPTNSHDYLWVAKTGMHLGPRGVYKVVTELTEAQFGKPINPHLFRDIAATSIAEQDPGHIGIAGSILGHLNPQTTEAHYIHASQVEAGRRHRAAINALRKSLIGDPINRKA